MSWKNEKQSITLVVDLVENNSHIEINKDNSSRTISLNNLLKLS